MNQVINIFILSLFLLVVVFSTICLTLDRKLYPISKIEFSDSTSEVFELFITVEGTKYTVLSKNNLIAAKALVNNLQDDSLNCFLELKIYNDSPSKLFNSSNMIVNEVVCKNKSLHVLVKD